MTLIRTLVVYSYVIAAVVHNAGYYQKLRAQEDVLGADVVQQKIHDRASTVAKRIMKLTGANMKVVGRENLPKEGAVLYVSNHQSFMDVPAIMAVLNRPTGFIAKDDLGKIPFFRDWVTELKAVLIARGDARKALTAIIQAAKLLQQGHSMVLYPEGTRSRDGKLLEFKAGSLKAAQKGNAMIVPVAVDGAMDVMKRDSYLIHKADVTITIMPAIPADEVKATDTKELADRVKKQIADVLGQEFVPQAELDRLAAEQKAVEGQHE